MMSRLPPYSPRTDRLLRRGLAVLYLLIVIYCTLQRGVFASYHTTFPIFRASFGHLLHGRNLYALYPAEQGVGPDDLFKYSPTAALLYAPFAIPPLPVGMFLWDFLNAFLLFYAVIRLLKGPAATLALALLSPEVLVALQASSSNALVTALVLLGFLALEKGRQLRGALAIAVGICIKIFPVALVPVAVFHRRRVRFALIMTGMAVLFLLLPLVAVPPDQLVAQYRWWHERVTWDATIHRGTSVMLLIHQLAGGDWPNGPVQAAGAALLLLPLALRRGRWGDNGFRRLFLCSLLIFMVIFNHEAERASYIIACAGAIIWYVSGPRGWWRTALTLSALVGLMTPPLVPVWLVIQAELLGPDRASGAAIPDPAATRPAGWPGGGG